MRATPADTGPEICLVLDLGFVCERRENTYGLRVGGAEGRV